ncbi:MAG: DUF5518 domain-containing protein [Halolamina sp.]
MAGRRRRRVSDWHHSRGRQNGFVGGLGVLWIVAELLVLAPTLTGPPWFPAVAIVFVGIFATIGLAFSILLGEVGAWVGGWLAERTGRRRPVAGSRCSYLIWPYSSGRTVSRRCFRNLRGALRTDLINLITRYRKSRACPTKGW